MYAARSIQCVHAVRHLRGTVRVAVEDHTGGNATEEGGSLCNDNNTFEWRDTRRRHAVTGNDREYESTVSMVQICKARAVERDYNMLSLKEGKASHYFGRTMSCHKLKCVGNFAKGKI